VSCRALSAGDRSRWRLPLCAPTAVSAAALLTRPALRLPQLRSVQRHQHGHAPRGGHCGAVPLQRRPARALLRQAPRQGRRQLGMRCPWFLEHAKPLFDQPRPTEQVTNMCVQCQLPCRSSRS
jgi:hypothetical protein